MNKYTEQIFTLAPALAEGALLGVFFFMGLWWTVRNIDTTKHVALWFLGSMLVRTSIVMLGFYFLMGDNWHQLLAGLLGFAIARIIVSRLIRSKDKPALSLHKASHES